MKNDIPFTNEIILEVNFFKDEDYVDLLFNGIKYTVIGNEYGIDSILLVVNPDNKIFYLDIYDKSITYVSSSVNVLKKELLLFDKYTSDNPNDSMSDDELMVYSNNFKKMIFELDNNAFCNGESFWSVVTEEMESVIIG